jgi:AcrR family transcriptional regulator
MSLFRYNISHLQNQQSNDEMLFENEQICQICAGKGKAVTNARKDRRIEKTTRLLQNALTELIYVEDYDAITVQQVLDRANVGRSTFYAHYENKDQLLVSLLDDLGEDFAALPKHFADHMNPSVNVDVDNDLILGLFKIAEQKHNLFKLFFGKGGDSRYNMLIDKLIDRYILVPLQEYVKSVIPDHLDNSLRLEMATRYYLGAFIGTLVWWLENDLPYTAEELYRNFKALMPQRL